MHREGNQSTGEDTNFMLVSKFEAFADSQTEEVRASLLAFFHLIECGMTTIATLEIDEDDSVRLNLFSVPANYGSGRQN